MLTSHEALTAHSLDEECLTQSPVQVVQAKRDVSERLTLYIPENFDIDKILQENPPDFPRVKGDRDYFVYIVHLINDIPSRNKDTEYKGNYIPLNAELLKKRVHKYRVYLDYLVENNVLVEDPQYIVGEKSRGFKFSSNYNTKVKSTTITKTTLIKSILKHINVEEEKPTIVEVFEIEYLFKWYNPLLTIDETSAIQWLEEKKLQEQYTHPNPTLRFNSRYIPLNKFSNGIFQPKIDRTAGRLHSTLTQLHGKLRPFIKYNNQTLVAVDITNSQPYLACVLFNGNRLVENDLLGKLKFYNPKIKETELVKFISENKNNGDVLTFVELVSLGKFYEEFGKLLQDEDLYTNLDGDDLRGATKEITFTTFFSKNRSEQHIPVMQIFSRFFPTVAKIFKLIKVAEHNTLACLLQNFEAKLVLSTACKEFSEKHPNAPIFTLHDSIITTEEYVDQAKEILCNVLLSHVGVAPTLSIEHWR